MLNARYHEQEAVIVADAGVPGAVTIATNMAGRGTDIQLGGNLEMRVLRWGQDQRAMGLEPSDAEVHAFEREEQGRIGEAKAAALAAGGLFVLGTERHESRRIDNQLRGRTGRQGDPGHSKFFLSTDDDLLRIFAGERLDTIMRTFGVAEGEAITHKWLNSAIATAQRKVEARNYEIRKNLLKYDDVVNDQRKSVFETRQEFMEATDLSDVVAEFRKDTVTDFTSRFLPPKVYAEQWDVEGLDEKVRETFGLELPIAEWAAEEGVGHEDVHARIEEAVEAKMAEREALISGDRMRELEKSFLLQMIDMQWREHLQHLDHLRQVIGLRGYGQRDPLNEYKTEAFTLFETLLTDLRQNVTRWVMTVEFRFEEPEPQQSFEPFPLDLTAFGGEAGSQGGGGLQEVHLDPRTGENERESGWGVGGGGDLTAAERERLPVTALPGGWERTGRNTACPCGSGKKFKHCHGALV